MFSTVFWHLGSLVMVYTSRLFYFGTLFNTLAKLRASFGQCEASLDKLWHSSLPRGHFVTLPAHLFSWFLLKANFLRKPVNVRVRCPVHRVRTFLRCQSSQFHSQCCSRGKLDSLNASSLSNIITQSLLICICEKSQYGLINLPKRISTEKCDFKNSCQKVPMIIIGLIISPGFSWISVQNWSFCGSCKRLHGRVAPSRHPPAITLHPVTAPPVTPKPNLGQKSDQESWSAASRSVCRFLQDRCRIILFLPMEGEGGNKKPESLVTQSSEPSSRQSRLFAGGDILPFQFS